MPNSGDNVRFQLFVNGKLKKTAALASLGVLDVSVGWVRRDLARVPDDLRQHADFDADEWEGNQVQLVLGGLDSVTDQHLEWLSRSLKVGDEVTVRILPPGEFDSPVKKRTRTRSKCRSYPTPVVRPKSNSKSKKRQRGKGRDNM